MLRASSSALAASATIHGRSRGRNTAGSVAAQIPEWMHTSLSQWMVSPAVG